MHFDWQVELVKRKPLPRSTKGVTNMKRARNLSCVAMIIASLSFAVSNSNSAGIDYEYKTITLTNDGFKEIADHLALLSPKD